jgi:catechol 2,3-dioxygenase-like lactoylglutathione lyase family enzyme
MSKVIFGNHSAVRVSPADRERIRKFYCDILGGKIKREFNSKDDIQIGADFYISFLYGAGDGRGADKGVNYAPESVLSYDDFLKAIFLELKTDNIEEMKKKIVAFGVKVLDIPDTHLYFQAPGGQVFRLVGINEDLSKYERNVE